VQSVVPQRTVSLREGVEMIFSFIPAGSFLMGSQAGEEGRESYGGADETRHRVTLTRGFWLGSHPVMWAQWRAVLEGSLTDFKGYSRHPVEEVSWDDCREFCRKLGDQAGKPCRLPTEAEWEYACRSGTTTPFHFGEVISTDQVNYDGTYTVGGGRRGVFRGAATAVGSFPPNAWGLADLHGTVCEWCEDWYGPYPRDATSDPTGPQEGTARVLRGGSWACCPMYIRSAYRERLAPSYRGAGVGCRVLLELD
jgi:formylglycine-generating enzyme required for sulfatase activity